MEVPKDLRYTREHEWLKMNGTQGVVGITHFAQDQLGDVVFVEVPAPGTELEQESSFGVVESVKTVSDLYAPVSGKVAAVNTDLEANPEWVNQEPYGKGWMIEIELSDPGQAERLLSADDYEAYLKEQQG
ncbi:MAG: glycine cleavage system protein GcvH [Nitrospina sp.]|nr:MAG: glycine cleavage system protein GcvH [Nitrospina sp.]